MNYRLGLTLLSAAFMCQSGAAANNGNIFDGIANIPRIDSTASIDGCSKTTKGLINNGGFLLFTCEKLLPHLPISEHEASFKNYQSVLASDGWTRKGQEPNKVKYVRTDNYGCKAHLEVTLWKDRSMNEGRRPAADRDAHRQIVFMAKFYGSACDRYYPLAQAMAAG